MIRKQTSHLIDTLKTAAKPTVSVTMGGRTIALKLTSFSDADCRACAMFWGTGAKGGQYVLTVWKDGYCAPGTIDKVWVLRYGAGGNRVGSGEVSQLNIDY